jgi:hypothetical protein
VTYTRPKSEALGRGYGPIQIYRVYVPQLSSECLLLFADAIGGPRICLFAICGCRSLYEPVIGYPCRCPPPTPQSESRVEGIKIDCLGTGVCIEEEEGHDHDQRRSECLGRHSWMADALSTRHAKLVAPQNCFMLARIAKCSRDWTPKNF